MIRINMELSDEESKFFEKIKGTTGLRTNAEVVRFCIKFSYDMAVRTGKIQDTNNS